MCLKIKTYFLCASLFLILSNTSIASAEKDIKISPTPQQVLKIVTPLWKNFTEIDGSGFYLELMRLIYEPLNISIVYENTPWARSLLLVKHQQADALLGSYLEEPDIHHFPKKPIWIDISAAAFKRSNINWRGLSTLEHKKTGWIRGYNYDDYLDVSMLKTELIDNNQAWELLELDRIEFYIDSVTDLILFMREHQISKEQFRIEKVLTKPMFVKFALTPKGKRFADIYDQRILELIQSNQLKELYIKWGYYEDHYQTFLDAL